MILSALLCTLSSGEAMRRGFVGSYCTLLLLVGCATSTYPYKDQLPDQHLDAGYHIF
jgi:hypothetical protein